MALWFGAGLFANSDIRRSFANPAEIAGLRIRMQKTGIAAIAGGVATIVSGVAMVFVLGGFAVVPWPIHAALGLALLQAMVGGGGIGATWAKIDKQLGEGASPETLLPLAQRIYMFGGIFHALWLINLILMVFRSALV